jgi:hypothetical protein
MPADEQAARQKASKKKHEAKRQRRRKAERRAAKRTPIARALVPDITRAEVLQAGLTVTKHKHRDLAWMDQHGKLHRERELSAEQLIRRYEKEHPHEKTKR